MLNLCVFSLLWFTSVISECKSESLNVTIDIIHRQVLDEHMVFFVFKNPYRAKPLNETYSLQYRCLEGLGGLFCPQKWVPLTACSVTDQVSCVFYSCSLQGNQLMLFNKYLLRGSALSPYGWKNATLQFKVKIPVYPKLENLTATAIDHSRVQLSWNKVALLSDLKSYKLDNIEMRMKILKSNNNVTDTLETILKPWTTSTILRGLEANQSYSFLASYHFVVSGLHLPSSTIAGPVQVRTPPKIIISSPPFNQSCMEISNKTGKYFNISWMVPSNDFPSQTLDVNIALKSITTVKSIKVTQKPSSQGWLVVAAVKSVLASIQICNTAGCSLKTYATCRLSNQMSQKKSGNIFLIYGLITAASIVVVLTVVAILIFFWRKRKVINRRSTEITPVGPRLNNQYDEALPQMTPYDNANIPAAEAQSDEEGRHSQMTIQQNEQFTVGHCTHCYPSPITGLLDNVSFDTKL